MAQHRSCRRHIGWDTPAETQAGIQSLIMLATNCTGKKERVRENLCNLWPERRGTETSELAAEDQQGADEAGI